MRSEADLIAALNVHLRRNAFNVWLGLELVAASADGVVITLPWRDEFMSNPDRGGAHGGILAALIDTGADFAIAARLGRPLPTIDLRVDYHRPAAAGGLIVRGKAIRLGRQIATAEASVFDRQERLLASGRGAYFAASAS